MKLIYLSSSMMDQSREPTWFPMIMNHPLARAEGWVFYNPWRLLREQPLVAKIIFEREPCKRLLTNYETLKLDSELLSILNDKLALRLDSADRTNTTSDLVLKDLYVLIRSDVMVVDLDVPSHGGKSQETYIASLGDIPIIGVTSRFVLTPWLLRLVDVLVPTSAQDSRIGARIAQQIQAFSPTLKTLDDLAKKFEGKDQSGVEDPQLNQGISPALKAALMWNPNTSRDPEPCPICGRTDSTCSCHIPPAVDDLIKSYRAVQKASKGEV
jgi:hypothetical protein